MDTRSKDPKGSKATDVQVIQSNNDLVLVEWTNSHRILQRAWVDRRLLTDAAGRTAKVANPEQGIPYGVEFWRLLKINTTSKDIDRELKQRGIWTPADIRSRPNDVIGALLAAYGVDRAALLEAAAQYEKDLKQESQ